MSLIDSHAHLDHKKLKPDIEEVVERAKQKGVKNIINVGITLDSCREAIDLAEVYPEIWATVGIHPHDADAASKEFTATLAQMVEQHGDKIVALGEMGLDYVKNYSEKQLQLDVFEQQLQLATHLKLPIIVHDRAAHEDALALVSKYLDDLQGGVFHCFSGDEKVASRVLEMGFYISFTGNISFDKAKKLHRVVKEVPLTSMMIETDCPYMAPVPFRGKRNEPAYVRLVAEAVAELKNVDLAEVIQTTGDNANALFKLEGVEEV